MLDNPADEIVIERMVNVFGEECRKVCTDALEFLKEKEPTWNLPEPINKYIYLIAILNP